MISAFAQSHAILSLAPTLATGPINVGLFMIVLAVFPLGFAGDGALTSWIGWVQLAVIVACVATAVAMARRQSRTERLWIALRTWLLTTVSTNTCMALYHAG